MLKKNKNAKFEPVYGHHIQGNSSRTDGNGLLNKDWKPPMRIIEAYHFHADGLISGQISVENFNHIMLVQKETPVAIMAYDSSTWWLFEDQFYWTDVDLQPDDVKALILAMAIRKKRNIERTIGKAKAVLAQEQSIQDNNRRPIPDDVKMFVWQRDNGRCVKCGSNQNLEFDHIIPVSQGGSNTSRNLQILCETCNRSKGGNIY